MRGTSKLPIATVLAALLLALGIAACGGSGDSNSTTTGGSSGQAQSKSDGGAASNGHTSKGDQEGNSAGGENDGSGSAGAEGASSGGEGVSHFVPKHHHDSGGGSRQFRVKGGDNSIQEFGAEAESSELDRAAAALHGFLDARAEGDWAAACSYVAKNVTESFKQLASQAKQGQGTSCAGILQTLTNPGAKQALKAEAAQADVGSLRIEGERAFVIYTGIGGTAIAMPMAHEGGAWKVASLAGTPLS